ncbi:hypothetical protein HOF65_04010 [bacterium]|nr:hypothetical protein [bacterium]
MMVCKNAFLLLNSLCNSIIVWLLDHLLFFNLSSFHLIANICFSILLILFFRLKISSLNFIRTDFTLSDTSDTPTV